MGLVLPPPRAVRWEPVVAGLMRGLFSLAPAILMLQVFDRAVPTRHAGDLLILALAVAVLLAAQSLMDLAARNLDQQPVTTLLKGRARAAALALFANGYEAPTDSRLPEVDATAPPPPILFLAALPVQFAALLAFTGAIAALPVLLCLVAAIAAWIGRGRFRAVAGGGGDTAAAVTDGLWAVKVMGAEQLMLRRAEAEARDALQSARAAARATAATDHAADFLDRLTVILAVLMGTVLTLNGVATVGQMAAGLLLTVAMVRAAFNGTGSWLAARGRAVPAATGVAMPETDVRPALPLISGAMDVKRVSFEAPADALHPVARMMFDRVSIVIAQGEAVRLTGGDREKQGLLLRLLAGLETPASGVIQADGHDLKNFRPDSLRRQIAYVPAAGDIFPGTLLENLTGFESIRTNDALGAARLVGLDARAARLTDGFDTRMDPGIQAFPAGFRQQVAVARALAAKPKVLLLDHATENLDSADARRIADVLERLKARVTIILASSRTDVQALADRDIDLDQLEPTPLTAHDMAEADDPAAGPPDGEGDLI